MALHIVLGFRSLHADSAVDALYAGRDADEARKAIATYKGAATKWVRNPSGVRKVNESLARSRDKQSFIDSLATRPVADPLSPEEPERLEAAHKVNALESENEQLRLQLAEVEKLAEESEVIPPESSEKPVEEKPVKDEYNPQGESDSKEAATSPVNDGAVGSGDSDSGSSATNPDPDAQARKDAARKQAAAAKAQEEKKAKAAPKGKAKPSGK